MGQLQHWAVYIDNNSDKEGFIEKFLRGCPPPEFEILSGKKGALFSTLALDRYIEEEARHDAKLLTGDTTQSLLSLSSGERKKALLRNVLESQPDFIILDNPWDNLDSDYQKALRKILNSVAIDTHLLLLIGRKKDILPYIKTCYRLQGSELLRDRGRLTSDPSQFMWGDQPVPMPIENIPCERDLLVRFRNINISYGNRPILHSINWDIRKNEFWQLTGPNGSGKSTLLTMITGDNPKAFGQELIIFGQKKGSGESVWDIKRKIGYFTPAMTDRFSGYHSLQNMLLSGLLDSVGLYVQPSEVQLRVAAEWLRLIGLYDQRDHNFHELSRGNQRLVMCARAMIKHPPLLILDEPTAGLDDASASLFVSLVNKIAAESRSAIIFVSHRKEPGLTPQYEFRLEMSGEGSTGKVIPHI